MKAVLSDCMFTCDKNGTCDSSKSNDCHVVHAKKNSEHLYLNTRYRYRLARVSIIQQCLTSKGVCSEAH